MQLGLQLSQRQIGFRCHPIHHLSLRRDTGTPLAPGLLPHPLGLPGAVPLCGDLLRPAHAHQEPIRKFLQRLLALIVSKQKLTAQVIPLWLRHRFTRRGSSPRQVYTIKKNALVLGLRLAIVAGGLENGKKLSDFPEFAERIRRIAEFRKKTEQFWVDGSFYDDIGLQSKGCFAKVYQTNQEVAIMVANLDEVASSFTFRLDGSHYGIHSNEYSVISSSGNIDAGYAPQQDGTLGASRPLEPYEMAAIVFRKGPRAGA